MIRNYCNDLTVMPTKSDSDEIFVYNLNTPLELKRIDRPRVYNLAPVRCIYASYLSI